MAIRVRGTIIIDRKHSRRGDFNVGDLCTEIGEFEVKDSLIEEFEPGKYTGDFMIKWIEPDSFSWRGRVFVKNRAQLDAILIDDIDEQAAAPAAPPEPDPIDNPPAPPVPDASQQLGSTSDAASQPADAPQPSPPTSSASAPPSGSNADQDLVLFGAELSEALGSRAPIKLDPTVDRQQFRAQRDRLKALAYSFDAKSQTWAVRQPDEAVA